MVRMMYRAQLRNQTEISEEGLRADSIRLQGMIAEETLMTVSLFVFWNQLFLYYEYCREGIVPEDLLPSMSAYLEDWPDIDEKRKWVHMFDVFHASQPQSVDHWRRKVPIEERRGMLLKLKPEKLGSYIYYHYQLQEELLQTDNKYCIIGLHENYLFYYDELPFTDEMHFWCGKLVTTNSPGNWSEVMEPHFIYWEGVEKKDMRRLPMKPLISL